jgi:hypothetical protein
MTTVIAADHKRKRIGIKPRRAEFNQDRCNSIMNRVVRMSLEEEDVTAE